MSPPPFEESVTSLLLQRSSIEVSCKLIVLDSDDEDTVSPSDSVNGSESDVESDAVCPSVERVAVPVESADSEESVESAVSSVPEVAGTVLVSAVDPDVSEAESDVSGDVSDEAALLLLLLLVLVEDVESVDDSESDVESDAV